MTNKTDAPIIPPVDLQQQVEALVRAYQDRLYAFGLRLTGSPRDAEEIAQDAFVRAYRALARYPAERVQALKLRAWLFALARNQCMHGRRHSRAAVLDTGALSMAAGSDADRAVLSAAVDGLTDAQLDTPYREGGWTVRQVVHHVADSHINSYTRFRNALTETDPLIKTYEEDLWAELADAKSEPIEVSLKLLEALHHRWIVLLRSLDEASFQRTGRHPELGPISVDVMTSLYAWHGRHHVAHIDNLAQHSGWR